MSLGKALARCWSAEGLTIVVEYLQDPRTLLSEQARTTGQHNEPPSGKEAVAWRTWLEQSGDTHEPRPLTEDPDITHDDDILAD